MDAVDVLWSVDGAQQSFHLLSVGVHQDTADKTSDYYYVDHVKSRQGIREL